MNLLALIPREIDGCVYHRVQIPLINLKGFSLGQTTQLDGMTDEQLKEWDVVLFNRLNGIGDIYKQIARLKRLKIKYVIDIDDAWNLPKEHLLYGMYRYYDIPGKLLYAIKHASYVFTTHDYLAKKIRRYNKNVEVVPNALDLNQKQWDVKPFADTVFGWCGGIHHWGDLQLLRHALSQIHSGGELIKLMLGGYVPTPEIWKEYASWFSDKGAYPHVKVFNGLDVNNYGLLYDQMSTCLIPLELNEFNKCKSELKMIEAGFKKKAVIVSNVHPYTNLINKENCLIVNDSSDWLKHIKRINKSKALEEELAESLYQSVIEKHNIVNVNTIREQVFSILA